MDYTKLAISAGVIALILLWGAQRKKRFVESFRGTANEAFFNLVIEASDPSFIFRGAAAEVLSEEEEVEQSGGSLLAYQLKRIAKNSAGEYFYFVFRSDSKPYFKHLEHRTAKVLLGSKYTPKSD